MNCRICGTPIRAGETFCSLCGAKAEATESTYQGHAQPPVRQPDNQSYDGQSYRREDSRQSYRGEQYEQQKHSREPYGQYSGEPYGRQQRNGVYYSSEPAKSRKWLWITLSLVAVIAIAAVLILTMPFGNKPVAAPKGPWPFKGDTLQTKFVNDTFSVYSDSLAMLENQIDFAKLLEQPFDIKMDMNMKVFGQSVNMTMNAAYDNESLGVNMSGMGASVKALLLEDVLYMDAYGSVSGVDLNSPADLTTPMSLGDRLITFALGGNTEKDILTEVDYTALAEYFMNSIDEKCFETGDSKTTLTLHTGDIADALRTFAGKLEEDEELEYTVEKLVTYFSETSTDITKQIKGMADMLEKQAGTADFELVWEVSYKDEKPVAIEIKADAGGKEYVLSYSYERNGDSTDVAFEIIPGNISEAVSQMYNYRKNGNGVDFVATTVANSQTQTLSGYLEFSNNRMHGTETINVPGIGEETIEFNLTVNFGMPAVKVKDDGRFKMDTSGATIVDGSSMFGT